MSEFNSHSDTHLETPFSIYKLNHKFIEHENRDPRDFIYDVIYKNESSVQPHYTLHKNNIDTTKITASNIPNILITSGTGVLDQGNLGSCTAMQLRLL